MSASAMLWSSSPSAMGRASSPLNPNSHTPSRHQPPSSSPQTSPTPAGHSFQSFGFALGSPPTKDRATSSSFSSLASASSSFGSSGLRYPRPSQTRRVPTSSSYASARKGKQVDLFGHNDIYGPSASMDGVGGAIGDQVSPVEGAMWKERFDRRIKDRERRQRVREMDIGRRRGFDPTRDGISEEELDQQAQADDEEIFRRLMVMQRRKAQSAQLIAHERELGGSDPAMPEFWEDEPLYEEAEGDPPQDQDQHMASSPIRPFNNGSIRTSTPIRGKNISSGFIGTDMRHRVDPIEEEDRWAMEAAEAEEAEREAEEAAVAQRLEMAYGLSVPRVDKELDDMEWDDFDAMDIE